MALAALVFAHREQIWHLYALSFLFGVADAFASPASQTFLPSLVTPAQLPAANALTQGTAQLSQMLIPAPAGIFVAALGIAAAFSIDAVSFLFVIAALLMLRDPTPVQSSTSRAGIFQSIVEGLRYVKNDVPLRSFMLMAAVLNFCITGVSSL